MNNQKIQKIQKIQMYHNNFDEYQLLNRYKAAFQTLMFLLAAVFINGFVSEKYMWASPSIQAMMLLVLASGYFVTVCIFKNAYISNKVRKGLLNISVLVVLGLLNVGISISPMNKLGIFYFVKEGKLQSEVVPVIIGGLYLYIGLIAFIKYLIDKKQSDAD